MGGHAAIVLLTRPRARAQIFGEALGLPYLISPTSALHPVGPPVVPNPKQALIFTSPAPIELGCLEKPSRQVSAYCVGTQTAQKAAQFGLGARCMGATVQELAAALIAENPSGPLLYLRGKHVAHPLAKTLTDAGLNCAEAVVYDQIPQELSQKALDLLVSDTPVVIPLFSARGARLLSSQLPAHMPPFALVPISSAVKAAWNGPYPDIVALAETPDADAMQKAVTGAYDALQRLEGPEARL